MEDFTYDALDYLEEYGEIDFYLVECELCHQKYDLQQIRISENGVNVYCDRCRN